MFPTSQVLLLLRCWKHRGSELLWESQCKFRESVKQKWGSVSALTVKIDLSVDGLL